MPNRLTVGPTMTMLLLVAACGDGDGLSQFLAEDNDAPVESGQVTGAATTEYTVDGTAHSEVSHPDGSVARLDVGTDLAVTSSDPAMVRAEMRTGRSWHRIPSSETTYEVVTAQGLARVTDPATFFVSCPDDRSCIIAVVEGEVDVEPSGGGGLSVTGPAATTMENGAASTPVPLPFDSAFGDPWLLDNGRRDQAAGAPSPGQIYAEFGLALAGLGGTYDASGGLTRLGCVGSECADLEAAATDLVRTYEFVVECESGACGGRATTEYQIREDFFSENVPLRFDGSSYRWDLAFVGDLCFDGIGNHHGEVDARFEWTLTPTAAEIVDGRYLTTTADIDVYVESTPIEPTPPECAGSLTTYDMDQLLFARRRS